MNTSIALLAFAAMLSTGDFRNPPASARPHTWWHWMNGNVTKDGITADLEAMARVGLGGAQIFDAGLALPKGGVDFASDEWYDMVAYASREAKRLGLELCLANCSGWTSSAGPWITPELSMKFVTNTVVRVKGGTRFDGELQLPKKTNGFYEDIAVLAFPAPAEKARWKDFDWQVFRKRGAEHAPVMPQHLLEDDIPCAACVRKGDIVDLTSKFHDGRLVWDVPESDRDWLVLRIGYMANGRKNRSASAAGLGLECDKLDAHALDVHFDAYIGEVLRRVGKDGAFNNVLLDSYEVHGQNWTRGFERTFAARTGYAISRFLPVLAGYPVESAAETERFLRDFRLVLSEEFVRNYPERLRQRCHENGLLFSCEPYGNGPFNDLAYARHCDIPMSEFWQPLVAGVDIAALSREKNRTFMEARWGNRVLGNARTVAATAHVWGMRIIGAEACTAYPSEASGRWLQGPRELKAQIDRVFSDGVNRLVFHRFAHQPWTNPTRYPGMTMAAYGGHFDRTQTWWEHGAKEFISYLTRAQCLLQRGTFAADVLVCTSGEAPDYGTDGSIPVGYNGDRCHPDALAECRVEDGKVVVPGGVRYGVVSAPRKEALRPCVSAALSRLAAAGATIVEYGAERDALARLGLEPDFICDDRDVTWIHRVDGDDDIYFVAIPSKTPKSVKCSFRVAGKTPELWDAMDGSISRTAFSVKGARTEVELKCESEDSVFVVFRKSPSPMAKAVREERERASLALNGDWDVSFREPGAAKDVAHSACDELKSWTESANDDIKYFSGTATYVKTVELPPAMKPEKDGERLVLDLGEVGNIAEVTVNGKSHPALWEPPYKVDVTDDVGDRGVIEIRVKVTNYWPNRLIGDMKLADDCEWDDGSKSRGYPLVKKYPKWLVEGKPSPTGRHAFSTCRMWSSDEPLLPSGLLGPVALRLVVDDGVDSPTLECVAHRGYWSAVIPENTVEAIKRAYDCGADWVETDFNLMPDGRMLCFHDPKTRDRVIKPPFHVPTLEEVLSVVPKDRHIQCEIKAYGEGYAEKFDAAVKSAGLTPENIIVSGFSSANLKDFKRKAPQYRTLWLVYGRKQRGPNAVEKIIEEARDIGVFAVCPGAVDTCKLHWTRAEADRIRSAGFSFRLFGVNTPELLSCAAELGAEAFTCNFFDDAFRWAEAQGVKLNPRKENEGSELNAANLSKKMSTNSNCPQLSTKINVNIGSNRHLRLWTFAFVDICVCGQLEFVDICGHFSLGDVLNHLKLAAFRSDPSLPSEQATALTLNTRYANLFQILERNTTG